MARGRASRRALAAVLAAGLLALAGCGEEQGPEVADAGTSGPVVPTETRTEPPQTATGTSADPGSTDTPTDSPTTDVAAPTDVTPTVSTGVVVPVDTPTAAPVTTAPLPPTSDPVQTSAPGPTPAPSPTPTPAPSTDDGSGGLPFDVPVSGCKGAVTVKFPVQPEDGDLSGAHGAYPKGTDLTLKTMNGGESFLNFACAQLPPGSPFDANGGLRGSVDGSAQAVKGKVTKYTPTTIQGYQGVVAEISVGSVTFYMQAVAGKGRLSFIQGTPKGYFDRFAASWKLS